MADNKMLDVLIIGAGFDGVCTAIKLKQAGIQNIRIYDPSILVPIIHLTLF